MEALLCKELMLGIVNIAMLSVQLIVPTWLFLKISLVKILFISFLFLNHRYLNFFKALKFMQRSGVLVFG